MSTLIYILIGIVILGLLISKKIKKSAGFPILKVRIGTIDGCKYDVNFKIIHSETKEIEYVRMVLNFTAKILFIIGKENENISDDIMYFLKKISETDMKPKDIERYIPSNISIHEGIPDKKIIEGVLYFKDMKTRNILTKLPISWFDHQLSNSVIVLTKVTVDILDDYHREHLKKSLRYMVEEYEKGVNPKEVKNMTTLPNLAFLSNIFNS